MRKPNCPRKSKGNLLPVDGTFDSSDATVKPRTWTVRGFAGGVRQLVRGR